MDTTIRDLDSRIGLVIQGYTVIERLGGGGMGDVYKAEHPEKGLAAVKFLNTQHSNPGVAEAFRKRFEAEGRGLMKLRGTTYVAVIYSIHKEDPYAIITEYVEGVPFSACLEGEGLWSPASQLRLFEVIVKVAGALVKVHEKGIIHRDVKPDNIMIKDPRERSLDPRLIDFGISRMEPDEGSQRLTVMSSGPMGSIVTAAPEQLRGHMDIGPTADVFALGILAYLIFNSGKHLYGEQPEEQTQVEAVLWAMSLAEDEVRTREALKKIDPRVAEVIGPCIRAYPEHRVQTMEEAHRRFEKLYLQLLMEQKAKSDVATVEVKALSEKDLGLNDTGTAEPSSPGTLCYGTNPGRASQDPEPKLEQEVKAKPRHNPEPPEKVKKGKRRVLGFVGAGVGVLVALAVFYYAVLYDNPPSGPIHKKHSKATHQVKAAKPPVMKRVEKKPPVMRPRPRPVKRVTPPPPRRVVKRPKPKLVDPCKRKSQWEVPSDKCLKLHCRRKAEARPSDLCTLFHYLKAWIKCYKEYHSKDQFEKYPGRVVQCLAKYADVLRGRQYDNFDRVAEAALFVQEIRTNYCYTKRIRVCDTRNPNHYAKRRILHGVCGSMHLRLYGRGDHCKKNYLCYLKTAKSNKIKKWLKEPARVARTKRVRTKWLRDIRIKYPRATKCLDRP